MPRLAHKKYTEIQKYKNSKIQKYRNTDFKKQINKEMQKSNKISEKGRVRGEGVNIKYWSCASVNKSFFFVYCIQCSVCIIL